MKKTDKGFTLIELLVVIAIIGILSAIVLASLSTARAKAKDATVQGQLSSMRAAAEIYYSNQGSSYGTLATACNTASTLFTDPTSNMSGLITGTANAINGSPSTFTGMDCGVSATAWSVAAKLPSGAGYACVDSTGASRTTDSAGNKYLNATGADSSGTYGAHTAAGATVCN